MELVATRASGLDQAGLLQHVEVLRDRLPRRREAVLHGEPRAELEQRLPVALAQLVEDRSARGIGQGLEDVTHGAMICKPLLACQHRRCSLRIKDGWLMPPYQAASTAGC